MIKALADVAMENGTRVYVKYNAVLTVVTGNVRKGSVIPVQTIVDKYDNVMFPIRQTVAELDTKLGGNRPKDPAKAFGILLLKLHHLETVCILLLMNFQKVSAHQMKNLNFSLILHRQCLYLI